MTAEMPIISIIVPIYKVEKYILKCLESIRNQTFTNFEAILVDDGSPDNCGKICEDFAAKDSRFKVIHQANGGIGNARKNGMNIASGKYLGFVDPDDHIAKDMYEKLYKEAVGTKADIVICGHFRIEQEKLIPRTSCEGNRVLTREESMKKLADGSLKSYLWNKLYRKELFEEVKFNNRNNFEDLAVLHELFHQAKKIAYLHECLYYYFINPNGVVVNLTAKKEYDHFIGWHRRMIFLQQHYPDSVELTYDSLINFGARAYWLCKYRRKKELCRKVRELLKTEAAKLLNSRSVRTKNKVRLLEVMLKINMYRFYIPKAIRNGIEQIADE